MHYDILTSDLIQRAAQLARSLGHSYVGSAHLLLVMAREPGAVGQTLRLLGMDPDLTEAMARLLYGQGTPELPLPQGLTRGVAGASSWGGAGGKASGQPGNYAAASAAGDGKTGKQRRI